RTQVRISAGRVARLTGVPGCLVASRVCRTGSGLRHRALRLCQGGSLMSSIEVRPFRRADREQLTALVNAHAAAVVPGVSAAVNTVMNQLEREPGEFIVDPWVVERVTLVAEQRRRIVAAAHLQRFGANGDVGESY